MFAALSLPLLLWLQAAPTAPKPALPDSLIVARVRVGPVNARATQRSLRALPGTQAIEQEIETAEGAIKPALVLFPTDPTRRLEVTWSNGSPAVVRICPHSKTFLCLWRTASGISLGTTLKRLEALNGKPFRLWMPESNGDGALISFDGGRLAKEIPESGGLHIRFSPRMDRGGFYIPKLSEDERTAFLSEEQTVSSHPILQKLNPVIAEMWMDFPTAGQRP